jgi:hypothetical protein
VNSFISKITSFVGRVSPKVKAGLIWGALATLGIGWLNSVTPADLAWAGPAEPLLFSAIPILIGQIAAWIKEDPLRTEGAASLAAKAAKAADDAATTTIAGVTVSTPVASTSAVSTGPGTVVQSETVTPAIVAVQQPPA